MQNQAGRLREMNVIGLMSSADVQMCHQARGNLWVDVLSTLDVWDDVVLKHPYSIDYDRNNYRGGAVVVDSQLSIRPLSVDFMLWLVLGAKSTESGKIMCTSDVYPPSVSDGR